MKRPLSLLASLFAVVLACAAAVPSPEKLLPTDTIGLITIPDWDKAATIWKDSPMSQLWRDPAMKPFADKFFEKFKTDLITPLERELGVKLTDYADLVHGQVTLAFTPNPAAGGADQDPNGILLIDSKDKGDQLKKILTDLKKKWVDSGKKIKTDQIRDIEFTTLVIDKEDLAKSLDSAFPSGRDAKKSNQEAGGDAAKKMEITIGQSGSLLILGNAPKDLEKILIRLSGGQLPSLGEQADFESNQRALFRDAIGYLWVNTKYITDAWKKDAADSASGRPSNPLGIDPTKILDALGLNSLKTVALSVNQSNDGTLFNFFLGVPESSRRGLFKLISLEAKEASPPSFVPSDVTKFSRYRLDGPKTWDSLEKMLTDASPQMAGFLRMSLELAGKDKDPDFDFRRQLIGNLGNDVITLEKAPRSAKSADIKAPPSLVLVGSPNADQLATSIKTVSSSVSPPGVGGIKEREFLGRKVFYMTLPSTTDANGKSVEQAFSFAASGGYVAMTSDTTMLEEYLRSADSTGKKLAETPGLSAAAEKVGGMSTGLFGYENEGESFRLLLDGLRKDPSLLDTLSPVGSALDSPLVGGGGPKSFQQKDWFDFALLPPYDRIAKYFYFTVHALGSTSDGISLKTFMPSPPQLKK